LNYGILLAAGVGSRFGTKKQYLELGGLPVWQRSLQALLEGGVERLVIVVPAGDEPAIVGALQTSDIRQHVAAVVSGGPSRSESVQRALHALAGLALQPEDVVAIHDAARPFVNPSDVHRVLAQARACGGAILGCACTDTLKRVQDDNIAETIPRDKLILAGTPQVFWWSWLVAAYIEADEASLTSATDDSSLMEAAGFTVSVVIERHQNPKITRPEDWTYAQWLAETRWG